MSELESSITALLRADFGQEAAAGFPRLKRIPYTDIIWLLDYFAAQAVAEQEALLDGLARLATLPFFPQKCGPEQVAAIERDHPALARFRAPRSRMGYKGGTRYTDVKMLRMAPELREIGNCHEDYIKNCSPLAFQPRPDLLPDLGHLKPAKAPALRKLVNAAFARLFSPEKTNQGGGNWKYVGSLGNSTLSVWVDYASQYCGQLRYGVSVANPEHTFKVARLSYESLWDATMGWDYLTEENAERSIEFLPELVVHMATLVDRIQR
jgi:hypothetical protein